MPKPDKPNWATFHEGGKITICYKGRVTHTTIAAIESIPGLLAKIRELKARDAGEPTTAGEPTE